MFRYLLILCSLAFVACGDLDDYPEKLCSTRGELGCECAPKNTCKEGPDGVLLACVKGVCKKAVCSPERPGEVGCICEDDKPCQSGFICNKGMCEVDTGQSLAPPEDPLCFTPCKGDLVEEDGTVRTCSKDGLLPGCIGEAICRQGTCVLPSGSRPLALTADSDIQALSVEPGVCSVQADCPDFQSCIDGRCYSDCSVDSDCREGRSCYRRACRIPCSTSEDSCPASTVCTTIDGESGFCLPVAGSDEAPDEVVDGTFELSTTSLQFTEKHVWRSFRITNTSSRLQTFVVRKHKHRAFSDEGPITITEEPLFWLELAAGDDQPARKQELEVTVGAKDSVEIHITEADNSLLDRWDGILEVSSRRMGIKEIYLSYARSPEGQWAGRMYYIGNFPDAGIDLWLEDKSDQNALRAVGNAFIRRWGAMREGRISFREFNAALIAMQTESWKWESVRSRCPSEANPNPNTGCYLYENNDGHSIFSDNLAEVPIPTGVVEMPFLMNVRADNHAALDWSGKVVSTETLHLPGDPRIELSFRSSPNSCAEGTGDICINYLERFSTEVLVGGRYTTTPLDRNCSLAEGFNPIRTPWLVPGFEEGTSVDNTTGRRYRYECLDSRLPFGTGNDALNRSMARANPIPDGATRRRKIELIDGVMIDQSSMLILFRETLPSFLDPADEDGFRSYGYLLLTRANVVPKGDDYEGFVHQDFRPRPAATGLSCSDELITTILGGDELDENTAAAMGLGVIDGHLPPDFGVEPIGPGDPEKVHYLCVDTGYFDGGPEDDGSGKAEKVACPPESRVIYFTIQGPEATQEKIADLACQTKSGVCRAGEICETQGCKAGEPCDKKGSCGDTLQDWIDRSLHSIRVDPVYRCEDENAVVCSNNRRDLREGKLFYPEGSVDGSDERIFRPLEEEIAEAFRYKTRFRNRMGTSLGFAPQVCVGDAVPYCYDPEAIESIRERVDCAIHIYTNYFASFQGQDEHVQSKLKHFLVRNFSYSEEFVYGLATPIVLDGFERLNAELLIMMGDESFTSAFASRFDLAGQKLATFEGDLFEPNGITLSGGAGFQMYSLYQATQYYQAALDRFYSQASAIWASIDSLPPGQGFITQETTVSYFDRLIRASAQKTRVWSEIARAYQGFNRPDLARLVVERAYSQAHMEATILSQMMRKVSRNADAAASAQITHAVEFANHTYRAALLDMRNVYRDITDETSFYGIPPDYIPFPALEEGDSNAFSKILSRAREMARGAAEKEERALADARSFDTDSALFQAELGRIQSEAEDSLAEICGTFQVKEGSEVSIYPAIPRYAHLSETTRTLGDPCGLMGNGALNDAILELEGANMEFEGLKLAYRNLLAAIDDAEEQASEQCDRIVDFGDFMAKEQDRIISMSRAINALGVIVETTSNFLDMMGTLSGLTKCSVGTSTDCPTAAVSLGAYTGLAIAGNSLMAASNIAIAALENEIQVVEKGQMLREIEEECTALEIDTKFVVRDLLRTGLEIQLEIAKFQYDLKLAVSQIEKLRNEATSIMAGQAENEEMAINIEAARNDPNVRIYRNDAIAAADRTFVAALKEAYRATKVFEYYTSQSYAALDKLYLVRMVAHGDITLESYLDELEQDFVKFQETFGNPDTRVSILSLRDDILRIPRIGEGGIALTEAQRTQMLREKLRDVNLLDNRGYLSMPFATSFDELSPLTRNHKVRLVEAEIVGEEVGDSLGRIYLTQRGTGVVRSVDSGTNYYAFPTRTAVLNPFFNGLRPLETEVYRSERLRDRPYINTGWDLVFNQKDEQVNKDIHLGSLTDIRLYVYYTDFTEL